MKKTIRLHLTGNVQGMFFEQFIKQSAEKLGIKGFFRKLDNGKVEVLAEGNKDIVDEMAAICRRGSQHTQIRNVEEKEEKFQDFKDFRIIKI